MEWQPIETAPKGEWVLAWFISINPENVHAHAVALVQICVHDEGQYWDGHNYHPLSLLTHWMPLPASPTS